MDSNKNEKKWMECMYFVVWLYHKYLHGVVNMAISVVVEKTPSVFWFSSSSNACRCGTCICENHKCMCAKPLRGTMSKEVYLFLYPK